MHNSTSPRTLLLLRRAGDICRDSDASSRLSVDHRDMLSLAAWNTDSIPYLQHVITFSVLVYTLHTYLDCRQLEVILAIFASSIFPHDQEWMYLASSGCNSCLPTGHQAALRTGRSQGLLTSRVPQDTGLPGRQVVRFYMMQGLPLQLSLIKTRQALPRYGTRLCRWFSFISGIFHQGLELVLLSGGYLPWLWYGSEALSLLLDAHISWYSHSEIATTIIFFLLDGAKDTVLGLPFSLYR